MSNNFARRAKEHFREFPSTECTLPWRNPEPPTTKVEAQQRKPITVRLVLTTSQGNRISPGVWNDLSWRPALAAAGVIKVIGEKTLKRRSYEYKAPVFEKSRKDMFHVLRHTFASVQLEAGESAVSVAAWLGHSSPTVTLTYYAHFMPSAGERGFAVMDAWLAAGDK
ncbi:integrase [Streptacidiphilus sp. 4-A2]|nr:integrase [Streptacidiphilus sp. 4-A2]